MDKTMRKRYLVQFLLIVAPLLLGSMLSAHAQEPNQVAVIVQHGDGSLVTRCVTFSEPHLTGYQILTRSGLDVVAAVGPLGAAICAIEGEGCEAHNCFCSSPPDYWSYWKLVNGEWVYSQMGANSAQVHHGSVEGWTWGPGNPPPMISFTDVCAPPPPPTDIPTNTPQPTYTPTATPVPTLTPLPTATHTQIPTPTPTATQTPDNVGEPTVTPVPTPDVWFRLDNNPIAYGSCTHVRWDTKDATDVYLDGAAVPKSGAVSVCPTESTVYRLRVLGPLWEQQFSLTLGISGEPSATPTNTPLPTYTRTSTPTCTATIQSTATVTPEPPEPAPTQTDYPLPAASPIEDQVAPSPTSAPSPTEMSPETPPGTIDGDQNRRERVAVLGTQPAGARAEKLTDAQPETSPTFVRLQITGIARAVDEPAVTPAAQEARDIDPLVKSQDVGHSEGARPLPSGYVVFAVLAGGLIGLLALIGRR
jgi:hypothetical protein